MGKKSEVAFRFTVNDMNASLYFWTFTFKELLPVKDAAKRWHYFLSHPDGLCQCFPSMSGLRVFELHQGTTWNQKEAGDDTGSHGLHVHMVVNQYLPVDIVRKIAEKKGFGRIHVKVIPKDKANYLGKYLNKERAECMRGMRLWAPVGRCDSHKVRDIFIDSRWSACYQFLSMSIHGFKGLTWGQRIKIVTYFLHGQEVVDAMKIQDPYSNAVQEQEAAHWEDILRRCAEGTE